MKKGFVISWYYPPGNSSEGLVTFKLLKNSKYKYDVWTRSDQRRSVWDRKSDESKLTSKNVKVIKDDCEDMKEWVRDGVRYFLEHKDEYDFIMSRSMPAECHEIAIKIKEAVPGIKWVASFGDPIVDTPYINEITMGDKDNPYKVRGYLEREDLSLMGASRVFLSPTRRAKKYVWNKDKKAGNEIEKYFRYVNETVLTNADKIIYNNPYQFEHAFIDGSLEKFKSKCCVLAHSFDPSLYPSSNKKLADNKKISFVYVGHLDETRNVRSLLEAIKKMKQRDVKVSEKVEFAFYGHVGNGDKIYILDNDLVDIVKVKQDVDYLRSLKIIKDADWAILADANFTSLVDNCIYLPAKLMDYMGAGTNIFSISHMRGAGADIIRKVGGGKVVTHSADDIYLYLSKIIYGGYKPLPYNKNEVSKYEASNIAEKMDKIINSMLKEG